MKTIPEIDYRLLTFLISKTEPVSVPDLAAELDLDQSRIAAICSGRAATGEIKIDEQTKLELRLGKKGKELAGRPLPERVILAALSQGEGEAQLRDLPEITGLEKKEVGESLRWLSHKRWAEKVGTVLKLLPGGREALSIKGEDELLIEALNRVGSASEEILEAQGLNLEIARELLASRPAIIDSRERKVWIVSLTDAGRSLVESGLEPERQVSQLSSELLRSGEWRRVSLRPYDVTVASRPLYPGKQHPMVTVFEQTRRVFLELGFYEGSSSYVESSFWDFDALFQPQDHPARDMQDTFYLKRPSRARLPDEALVEEVRRTHEDGGDTGSIGWRYTWDINQASRVVLRTHTTATTIRALAADPKPPRKVFCIGPVFRRETADYKHLPVFHQVDGIIVDRQASFASLLGTLGLFYRKMGFHRFQFRPAFFPYTEPSVEVFVWSEGKGDWVEMGGAGMFRPEVTRPLGCDAPVLAWGLGLERLALFRFGLSSIGELYRARLAWLKEAPICP